MQLTCPNCGARYRIDVHGWPTDVGPEAVPVHRPRKVRCKLCRTVWAAVPEEEILDLDNPMPPDDGMRTGAAWAAVGGGPDPERGMLVSSEPVPTTVDARWEEAPAAEMRPRPRLPGPAAVSNDPAPDTQSDTDFDDDADEEAQEPEPKRRRRLFALAVLFSMVTVVLSLLVSGRLRPQDHGISMALPDWAMPASLDLPTIALPRAPVPPLAVKADITKRALPGGGTIWEVRGTVVNPTGKPQQVPPVEVMLIDAAGIILGRWTVRPEMLALRPGEAAGFESSVIDPPATAVKLRFRLKPAEVGRV